MKKVMKLRNIFAGCYDGSILINSSKEFFIDIRQISELFFRFFNGDKFNISWGIIGNCFAFVHGVNFIKKDIWTLIHEFRLQNLFHLFPILIDRSSTHFGIHLILIDGSANSSGSMWASLFMWDWKLLEKSNLELMLTKIIGDA